MQEDIKNPFRSLPHEFDLFLKILFATIALSFLDAFIRWPVQGAQTAFGALLLSSPFADIDCYWPRFLTLHSSQFFQFPGQPWTYPAPCAFIYKFLYKISTFNTFREVYLWLGILFLALASYAFGISLARAGLPWRKALAFSVTISVASWPIYFSFERGNVESYLWLLLASALWLYIAGHWRTAAIALGFVAAFKIYPILFLGLFLPARRYLALMGAVIAAALTTLAGLLFLGHPILRSARFTREGIRLFLTNYSGRYLIDVNGYDHSVWAFIKYPLRYQPERIAHLLRLYTPLAGLLALAFFLFKVWKAPRFNQLLAICSLMVLLPATSFDYTLQALYVPFAWLCLATVRAWRSGRRLAGASAYFACFALLFGPLVFIRSRLYTINGQVKAIVLLAMLYLVTRYPMKESDMSMSSALS